MAAGVPAVDVCKLTEREIGLAIEADHQRFGREIDLAVLVTSYLINVHIPRGKPRITPRTLRPKRPPPLLPPRRGRRRSRPPLPPLPKVRAGDKAAAKRVIAERQELIRQRKVEEEAEAWWDTPEGRRVKAQLDEELGPDESGGPR